MISNERQYRITKAQAEKFSRALQEASQRSGVDPLLQKLENDALQSQLHDLEQELREYEMAAFRRGKRIDARLFCGTPPCADQGALASGLTQKDLRIGWG